MKCGMCDNHAEYVTHFYSLNYDKLPFWSRVFRRMKRGKYYTRPVCKAHHLVCEHGIETIVCEECHKNTLVRYDDLFEMEVVYCCHCNLEMEGLWEEEGESNDTI
jgi:hypothetical protein